MKQLKGYVATLDVLGFSDLLQRDGYAQQLQNYMTCVNDVIRPATGRAKCVVFSDSIVLTSPEGSGKEDGDEVFDDMIRTCSAAFRALLKNGIPVRGAVAFGRYWREARQGSVFLAGRPIVEAYRCERSSNWVGILLCESVLHEQQHIDSRTWLPDLSEEDAVEGLTEAELEESVHPVALRLRPATVPFLDSETRTVGELSGYGVVPLELNDTTATASRTVASARVALRDLRLKAPQPRAQSKYVASLGWLEGVLKQLTQLSSAHRKIRKAAKTRASGNA